MEERHFEYLNCNLHIQYFFLKFFLWKINIQ